MSRMRNLTLASAKHLLTQGHISPAHHQRIVAAAAAMPTLPTMPKMKKPQKPPGGFGSLAKMAAPPFAQQAQTPIPGVGSGPPVIPPGIMAGNPED
jgi:hypothetical protein